MKSVDIGVLDHSSCFSFTPSESAKQLYVYPTWCGHYYCNSKYHIKRDYYPYLLLAYVRNGEFILEYQKQNHIIKKGQAFLIDCTEPHYYRASNGLEFLYIHFDGINAHELCQHITHQHGIFFGGDNALEVGKQLLSLRKRCEQDEVITAPEFSLFIYKLLADLTTTKATEVPITETSVDLTIRYIRNNVGKTFTLKELADYVNLSKYHYARIFKEQTGYSPMEYVISTRLDKAKVLLKATNMSVAEIAYEVGYENPGSFINVFSSKLGLSPTQFRRN